MRKRLLRFVRSRKLARPPRAAGDRHNSSIKSNIRRLRDLLEGTRVVIETDQDSYRLAVPPGSVLVPPRP